MTKHSEDGSLEARISELEAKAVFADDMLDELNRSLYRQQQEIDRLQSDLRQLRTQLAGAAAAESGNPQDEIPPHY